MKQLCEFDQRSEMAKYYAKLTGNYLLNSSTHGHSKVLKLSEWHLRTVCQRFTVSFCMNYLKSVIGRTLVIIAECYLLNPCSLRNSLIKFKVFKKMTNVTLVYFLYQEPLVKNMSYIMM